MNERDSEAVAARLVAKGYTLARSEREADVVLLNTCSVRDVAERRALEKMRALIGDFRHARRSVVLGFLGCMAQSRGADLADRFPDVDLVVGTQKLHRVGDYLDEIVGGRLGPVVDTATEAGSEAAMPEHLYGGPPPAASVTAYVSIMQGCNQYCTFCIVPYTRGLERSRSIADIVAECRELAERGLKEVTLLGQIVTSYGRRAMPVRDGKSPFVQLLEAVQAVDGIERIRFTAPHPRGYGDDLVEAYGRLSKLCEYAHLPMQSGSDRVLQLMHRGYTRARCLELVRRLRARRPEIGICTDLIAGFPGETEADFEQSCDLVREVAFDQAYLFKYSPRQDTPAAAMPDPVPVSVREERHARLLELVNGIARERYQRLVGRQVEVLIEGPSRKDPRRWSGRTRCNKIVILDAAAGRPGELRNVRVTRAGSFSLYGVTPDVAAERTGNV